MLPVNDPQTPGVPWLRTWRGVYWFVIGCFVFWVVFLFAFGAFYS